MIKTTEEKTKLAYSVEEIALQTSLSKAFLRNEIRTKKLKAKNFGRRVLVLDADLRSYLESKEDWEPTNEDNLGVKN